MRMAHCFVACSLATASAASGQFLYVVESTNDRVRLHSAVDGSLINENFIDLAAETGGVARTPIEALDVGNEIWVSDQVADTIWRFDRAGNLVGQVGGGAQINNVRGMELVGNTVYAVTGSNSTDFDEGLVRIDATTGSILGATAGRPLADISYFDVKHYNGELLVSNIDSGNDSIERYDLDGNFLGIFASSDGETSFDFAQQIAVRDNGNLLVGGFSLPSGVYEIDSDGNVLGIVAGLDFGPRGVVELENGEIAYTNGSFFQSDDNQFSDGSSFRYITETSVPAPASLAMIALGGIAGARRRR